MSCGGSSPWGVSMRRVLKIVDEERARGFQAFYTGLYSTLPDVFIMVQDNYQIIRVYEVTNYKTIEQYIHPDRAERYRDTLNQFSRAERLMVVSFKENLRYLPDDYFTKWGIKVIAKGYQD